jgi:hypothetical protein
MFQKQNNINMLILIAKIKFQVLIMGPMLLTNKPIKYEQGLGYTNTQLPSYHLKDPIFFNKIPNPIKVKTK